MSLFAGIASHRPLAGTVSHWAYLLARLLLAGVYMYAGLGKVAVPSAFAQVIAGYGLAPDWAVPFLAWTLPWLEILAGVALILDLRGSLAVITGLTLLFLAVLWHGIAMGLDIDCGCYAPGDPKGQAYHGLRQAFARDLGLLVLCFWCYWHRLRTSLPPRNWRSLKRRHSPQGDAQCAH